MLKSFCEWLIQSGRLPDLVIGRTLYAGFWPQDTSNTATAIRELTGAYVDGYNRTLREIHYQIMTRAPSYQAAEAEANRIFEVCVNLRGEDLTGLISGEEWRIFTTTGIAPAYIPPQDEKGRFVFSSNITLHIKKET